MATFVDTEERETARLRQAEEEGLAKQTLTPVIKECLRLKILSDRHSHGLPEYQTLFVEPVKHELRDDERAKLERRKQQNKEAARRCRQKKKLQKTAIETAYHEELRLKSDMDTEIRCIQQELESMQRFLTDHLKSGSCRIAHLSDSHVGYFPGLLPVRAPSDLCPSSADSQRQPENLCSPDTRHLEHRELSQEEHGVITSNRSAQLSEHHEQDTELDQSPSWIVPDKQRLNKTGHAAEVFDEGRTSNWSKCEVPRGHVLPSSYQVPQFPRSQGPGCGLMHVSLGTPDDDSHLYKGVCRELLQTLQTAQDSCTSVQTLNRPFEVEVGSFHNPDTMADNTDSILAGCGSQSSDQRHTHPPGNVTSPKSLPCEDTNEVEGAAGAHPGHPEDIPHVDIQVFPEDLHNLILEEIHGTPEDLHELYTTADDKTQPNFLMF
ncbi:uncharacterized protein [Haliotis asinina]